MADAKAEVKAVVADAKAAVTEVKDKAVAKVEAVETKAVNEVVAAETDAHVGLVKMVKDGVYSFVHETCVEAHKIVGWVRAHV